MSRRFWLEFGATVACGVARSVTAADGDVDASFGNSGVARTGATDVNAYADVVVQADGKIVTCATRTANGLSAIRSPRYDASPLSAHTFSPPLDISGGANCAGRRSNALNRARNSS